VSEEVEPDEDDKENNNMLAFEDDKENMSVVMGGSPTPRRPALRPLVGTSTRSLSSSDSLDRDASQSRTPPRELSVKKDVFGRALHDPSESPTRQGGSPFERKLRASQSPSKSIHDSPSRPQLLSKKLALSQFMDDNTQPAPAVKKGGLSQFMENTQPSLLNHKVGLSQFMDDSQPTSALLPRSGLMDAFDDDFDSSGAGPSQPQTGNDAFGRLRNVEAPSLTFDESIRPAVKLDLSEREREQAEAIFAKEQEMLIEDSMAPVATQAPLLWENTQGYVFWIAVFYIPMTMLIRFLKLLDTNQAAIQDAAAITAAHTDALDANPSWQSFFGYATYSAAVTRIAPTSSDLIIFRRCHSRNAKR
jgi:hypothetical protein